MWYKMAVDSRYIYAIYVYWNTMLTQNDWSSWLSWSTRALETFSENGSRALVLSVRRMHLWPFVTGGHAVKKMGCCLTSTETVGLLGTGAQDVHHNFHTAPELWKMGQTSCCFSGGDTISEVVSQTVCYSISFRCCCVIGQTSSFCFTRIFICQWHLNVHRNLSWWRSVHTVH